MPRQVLEFRVVVASPSDVYAERKAVFNAIDEVNRIFEGRRLSVRGLGWEEYAAPGVDVEPQAVVNSGILREYDLLIALFGATLGTPTATAQSGTVSEVDHAIQNEDSPMGQNRVQVYFRDKIENLSGISADDLKKIEEYRKLLGSKGVLYRPFKEIDELQKEVRVNIQRALNDFLSKNNNSPPQTEPSATESSQETHDDHSVKLTTIPESDELGILDYMENSEEALASALEALETITTTFVEITTETNERIKQLELFAAPEVDAKTKKRIINEFAEILKSKALTLKQNAAFAQERFSTFIDSVIHAIALERGQVSEAVYVENRDKILAESETLLLTLSGNRISLGEFRESVSVLPKITIQFNQAKKQLLDAVDECLELFDQTERNIFALTAQT